MVTLQEKILLLLYLLKEQAQKSGGSGEVREAFLYLSFARRYKRNSVRQRLWEMGVRGEIQKRRREGEDFFRLTEKGFTLPKKQVPLLRFGREWDGLWRVVVFDIGQKQQSLRDRLRRRLLSLGFGPCQRSLWLSPFNQTAELHQFLKEYQLEEAVEILEARRPFVSDHRRLAERVWRLDSLGKVYRGLGEEWRVSEKQYSQDWEILKKVAATLQERYLRLFWIDPGLPHELLPEDWPFEEVSRLLPEWFKIVS